jgi:hypothetical protein
VILRDPRHGVEDNGEIVVDVEAEIVVSIHLDPRRMPRTRPRRFDEEGKRGVVLPR